MKPFIGYKISLRVVELKLIDGRSNKNCTSKTVSWCSPQQRDKQKKKGPSRKARNQANQKWFA
jgi:hypothetical protein